MTSKIKVDNINKVSDDSTIIKKCGSTTTVGSGAGNTIVVCGATVTIGRCGGTVALASGATQSGFGRSGSVDWQTTPKTTTFTAASGEGYFVDTSSGAVTMNLPAGSAGAIVAVADYTRTFATHNLTIVPNGSNKIGGVAANAILSVDGQAATFVFVDATEGWINVQNAEDTFTGNNMMQASGGTESTSGNFKIHTFTGPGTFTVSAAAACAANNIVDYLVVGGGGGGQWSYGGGGGGGFRFYADTTTNPQSGPGAPRNGYGPACSPTGTQITVTATGFPITVGAGGAGSPSGPGGNCNTAGGVSTFSTVTSAGGGKGGCYTRPTPTQPGTSGGSGGGGGSHNVPPYSPGANPGGTGNTPPVTPSQGSNGGAGLHVACDVGGGGGGAMAVGTDGQPPYLGGNGGAGAGITGFGASNGECSSCVQYFSGGGGGAASPGNASYGGRGLGGGSFGFNPAHTVTPACGAANQGGGGGGGNYNPGISGTGGSGIVVIRYKFQ